MRVQINAMAENSRFGLKRTHRSGIKLTRLARDGDPRVSCPKHGIADYLRSCGEGAGSGAAMTMFASVVTDGSGLNPMRATARPPGAIGRGIELRISVCQS